ncbi:MAG: hypothetical protein AAFX50_10695 [Acidobacteriota bacterium]
MKKKLNVGIVCSLMVMSFVVRAKGEAEPLLPWVRPSPSSLVEKDGSVVASFWRDRGTWANARLGYSYRLDPALEMSTELETILRRRARGEERSVASSSRFSCAHDERTIRYEVDGVRVAFPLSRLKSTSRLASWAPIAVCWGASVTTPVPLDVLLVFLEAPQKQDSRFMLFLANPEEPEVWQLSRIWFFDAGVRFEEVHDESRWGLFQERDRLTILIPLDTQELAYEIHPPKQLRDQSVEFRVFPLQATTENDEVGKRNFAESPDDSIVQPRAAPQGAFDELGTR